MRKIFLAIFLLVGCISYALNVKCVGNAAIITHENDTIFLFEESPEVQSTIGSIDWYRLPDTINPMQSGTDYLYPEHGEGYMIKVDSLREYFWIADAQLLRTKINHIEAILSCENTVLNIEGEIPDYKYINRKQKNVTLPRKCHVSYLDARWDGEQWVDSLAVVKTELTNTITVGASPVVTNFVVVDELFDMLNLPVDSFVTDTYEPLAAKAHPQAIVIVRGKDGERSNEVERPIDKETLIRRSAPLTVDFIANGLNTDYYDWTIYRGTDPILARSEAQHKYTFTEPGNYSVVLKASNRHECAIDSVEFEVSVSESMLKVPNVFTPNGDGSNDEFRVVYRSIREYDIRIYNRWGHLVYKSNDPAKGWDGTIHGRPAAESAYFYVIRAMGTDAGKDAEYMLKPSYQKALKKQELPLGVYQLSGSINLLRGGK